MSAQCSVQHRGCAGAAAGQWTVVLGRQLQPDLQPGAGEALTPWLNYWAGH